MTQRELEIVRSMSMKSKVAIALAALAIVVMVWSALPVLSAMLAPSLGASEAIEPNGAADDHATMLAQYQHVVNERSMFFDPAPPKAPPPPPPPPPGDKPEPANRTPREYNGPDLIGLVGDRAYFASDGAGEDALEVSVGEREGPVELIRIELPWFAHVRWSGGEYRVNLFDKASLDMATGSDFQLFQNSQPTMSAPTGGLDFGSSRPARPSRANGTTTSSTSNGVIDIGIPQGDGELFIPIEEEEETGDGGG